MLNVNRLNAEGKVISIKFNVRGSVHRNNILVYKFQQDAQVKEFILSDNCSTCFGRHYHPSSGAQKTLNTASGKGYTVRDRVKFNPIYYSVTVTRCYSYSCFVLLKMCDSDARNM